MWRWQAIAPAMSIRCITVPPRMNPSGFASFGRTTCTISVADSAARFAVEVIAHPTAAAPGLAQLEPCVQCCRSPFFSHRLRWAIRSLTPMVVPAGGNLQARAESRARGRDDSPRTRRDLRRQLRAAGPRRRGPRRDAADGRRYRVSCGGERITPASASRARKAAVAQPLAGAATAPGARGWRVMLLEFQA